MEKDYRLFVIDDLASVTPAQLDEALAALPDWRRERALRFKHEQGRVACALSYLLLCRALREVYGIDEQPAFVYGEHGKPSLSFTSGERAEAERTIHFNLSHCKHAVACVVSSRPVGVDVECTGRYREALARHVFNQQECHHMVQATDTDLAFTRLWTKKEAIVKLTGRGIDDDLKNLLLKYSNVLLDTEDHPDRGYVVTVATFLSDNI